MSSTSLEHKTIRPGSLLGYSYYHSSRQTTTPTKSTKKSKSKNQKAKSKSSNKLFVYLVLILSALILLNYIGHFTDPKNNSTTPVIASSPSATPIVPAVNSSNVCANIALSKSIIISISQRHLWACQNSKQVYSSAVVTGISYLSADITPVGTYSIYSKQTNADLVGSDSTGSWNDHVYYWMPFLQNQYGTYGLHDATWRSNSDFGNVSPSSPKASHGCVELPFKTAKWLYNWVDVGTQVTINN